jgi:hypothetical protein
MRDFTIYVSLDTLYSIYIITLLVLITTVKTTLMNLHFTSLDLASNICIFQRTVSFPRFVFTIATEHLSIKIWVYIVSNLFKLLHTFLFTLFLRSPLCYFPWLLYVCYMGSDNLRPFDLSRQVYVESQWCSSAFYLWQFRCTVRSWEIPLWMASCSPSSPEDLACVANCNADRISTVIVGWVYDISLQTVCS